MKYTEWVKKYCGQKLDYDKMYGIQCVDLADHYIVNCLGLKLGFYGNARNWVDDFNKSSWLKDNFTLIKCTFKSNEIKKGDIGVRDSGTYGHIFVCDHQNNSLFVMYDQNNGGTGAGMTKRTYKYCATYITHLLRPKNRKNIDEVTTTTTSKAPTYSVGKTYTLQSDVNVRIGAGTKYSQKKKSQLTSDGQKNALNQTYATLKKGTKVTVKKVVKSGNDIWLEVPSGYLAAFYNSKTYIK